MSDVVPHDSRLIWVQPEWPADARRWIRARLAVLPSQLERLLDDPEALLLGRPEGVTPAERDRLRALIPEFARACSELAAYGIPETLQHDDLHDGNVFVRDGAYVFFDWGDS